MSHVSKSKKNTGDSKQRQASSHVSTDGSLKRIIFEHRPQVHLNFYSIITMEKVAIASTATKNAVKRLIDDLGTAMSTLGEAKDKISKGFEDLIKDQDALAAESGVIDVDGSEILDINTRGVLVSMR